MKVFSLLLATLFVFSLTSVTAQSDKQVKATALRVSKAAAAPYQTKHNGPNFDIDSKGILRPHKGYQILLNLTTGQFRVATEKHLYLKIEDGFDVQPIPGGMMWCFCDAAADDCDIDVTVVDNKIMYFCGGRCGCVKLVESDTNWKIPSYESPGGGWFNF